MRQRLVSQFTPRPLRVVVAGVMASLAFSAAAIAAAGDLDPTFSGDGKQTTDFAGADRANGVAIQADGKIVAVGRGGLGFALARYNPNGSLDTSFSGDGRQTADFLGADRANGVAIQANGKIVAVGEGGVGFALARYNPNGTLDTSFSGDGRQTTDFGASDGAHGVAIQADGKIVAVGEGSVGLTLARYNPNGTLDTSFSGDGKQTLGGFGSDATSDVALQTSGKIVAVGTTFNNATGSDFGVARFNGNGTLDTSFSGDGKKATNFGGDDGASGVALQGDGQIVVVGFGDQVGASNFALTRYNPNGTLDTSFSGDGKQTTDFGGDDGASDVALQGDGKIVTAGIATGGATSEDFALGRYNSNGTLDSSFSADGRRRTNFGGIIDEEARGVALQGDGKIVAVGAGFDQFALARYLGG